VSDPAYAHYTLERRTSEKPADPKKAFVQALKWGWRGALGRLFRKGHRFHLIDPRAALDVTDTVKLKDIAGTVIMTETFDSRDGSEARANQITSDLLRLDVDRFRETYGIR
jgi:hypothetical protein